MNSFTDEIERRLEVALKGDLESSHAHLSSEQINRLLDFRLRDLAVKLLELLDDEQHS